MLRCSILIPEMAPVVRPSKGDPRADLQAAGHFRQPFRAANGLNVLDQLSGGGSPLTSLPSRIRITL